MSGGYGGLGNFSNPNSPSAYGQQRRGNLGDPNNQGAAGYQGVQGAPQQGQGQQSQGGQYSGVNDPNSVNYNPWASGQYGGQDQWAGNRVGSVNYNALGNLTQLAQNNPAAAAMLRTMGLMPTYNGMSVDQATPQANGGVGTARNQGSQWGYGDNGQVWTRTPDGGYSMGGQTYGADGRPSAHPAAPPGGAGALGGSGGLGGSGAAPRTGLPLEQQLESGYGGLISSGGHVLSPFQESALVNQSTDTIAQGQNDALQQARLDALRRGDTSGSSLGSTEAGIRMQGANMQQQAAQGVQTGLREEAANRLMGALGGGSGLYGQQLGNLQSLRQYELLQGQLQGPNAGLASLLGMSGVGR